MVWRWLVALKLNLLNSAIGLIWAWSKWRSEIASERRNWMSVSLTRFSVPDSLGSVSKTAGISSQSVSLSPLLIEGTHQRRDARTLLSLYTSSSFTAGSRGVPRLGDRERESLLRAMGLHLGLLPSGTHPMTSWWHYIKLQFWIPFYQVMLSLTFFPQIVFWSLRSFHSLLNGDFSV